MRSNSTALRIRARKSPKPPSPSSQDDVDVEQSFRRPPASFLVAVARFASRDDARLYRYDAAHASPASETSLPREIRSKGSPSASVGWWFVPGMCLRADQQSVRVMLDPFMVNSWCACTRAVPDTDAGVAHGVMAWRWQDRKNGNFPSLLSTRPRSMETRLTPADSPPCLHPANPGASGPAQRMAAQDNKTEKKRSWTSQLSPHRSAVSSCRRG